MTTDEIKTTKKKKPKRAPESETKTPDQWCHDLRKSTPGRRPNRVPLPIWQHNAAAALHGWARHAHEANAPIQLSRAAYLGALDAVEETPSTPCADALSPYQNHKG